MIERDSRVRDYFLVLERKQSFGDYARAYGDAIARHYEDCGVIVVPFMPIDFDLEFFQGVSFPAKWKKIGTSNRIEDPVVIRRGAELVVDQRHPFVAQFRDMNLAAYLQAQIARVNSQLRHGLSVLFPRYRSMEGNITWRLLETIEEGMHLDSFHNGIPLTPALKSSLRLKIFINLDTEPRRWRTSLELPAVLKNCKDKLPIELPDDLNVVNDVINKFGVLQDLPAHRVAFPTMSALFVNAEVLAHEVLYGRRMVAGEFFCRKDDMLDPQKLPHARLRGWLEQNEYTIADDAAAIAARYAHMTSSYQLVQEARAGTSA